MSTRQRQFALFHVALLSYAALALALASRGEP
jgi:hypothetical protein